MLQKKLKLSDEAMSRISDAVKKAESKTTGEIVVAATKESSNYAFWEFFFAFCLSVVAFVTMLRFSEPISIFLERHLWALKPWYLPAFIGAVSFSVVGIFYFFANIPAVDRAIIPSSVKNYCVSARALRHFTESGVYETEHHSGILIFISYMERQVRIIADKGINSKIHQDLWDLIADTLASGIGEGKTEEAIISAIEQCGDLLEKNFPITAGEENSDELSNGMQLLEDSAW